MIAFRAGMVTCLAILAVFLPGVLISHMRACPARRDTYLLVGMIWAFVVAAIYAVIHDWERHTDFAMQDGLRVLAILLGATYVWKVVGR